MIYVRKVGPYVVHRRKPGRRLLKSSLMVFILIISIALLFKLRFTPTWENLIETIVRAPEYKCGLPKPCPEGQLAFKVSSGAATIKGPQICLDGEILIGDMKKNWGLGINIAVINGQTGKLVKADSFDMWDGEVEPLIEFLKSIKNGSLVLIASCDDPTTKLNDEAITLIHQLGSFHISELEFRDNWVFVGAKAIKNITPLEKYIRNDKSVNKYGDWPEMVDIKGCMLLKQDYP